MRARHVLERDGLAIFVGHARPVASIISKAVLDTDDDPTGTLLDEDTSKGGRRRSIGKEVCKSCFQADCKYSPQVCEDDTKTEGYKEEQRRAGAAALVVVVAVICVGGNSSLRAGGV